MKVTIKMPVSMPVKVPVKVLVKVLVKKAPMAMHIDSAHLPQYSSEQSESPA